MVLRQILALAFVSMTNTNRTWVSVTDLDENDHDGNNKQIQLLQNALKVFKF